MVNDNGKPIEFGGSIGWIMINSLSVPNRYFVTDVANALAAEETDEKCCILRLVLDSPPNCDSPMARMPGHPKAVWGSVYHSMAQDIHAGDLREENLDETMSERIRERLTEEEECGVPWAAIDLQKTSSLIEIRRRCKRLEELRSSVAPRSPGRKRSSGTTRTRTTGREVFVSGIGGRITGLIDQVDQDLSGVSIIDDKTGKVHMDGGEVKQSYIRQVTIYAALYEDSGFGKVSRVVLKSKSGKEVFSHSPSSDELAQTISELTEFMNRVDRSAEA